jgi:hypothetical protein
VSEPEPVARMTVSIEYADGRRATYQWVADTRPVTVSIRKQHGDRQAQAGPFIIEASRWPGSSAHYPAGSTEEGEHQ